jgi:hypothetical protein
MASFRTPGGALEGEAIAGIRAPDRERLSRLADEGKYMNEFI